MSRHHGSPSGRDGSALVAQGLSKRFGRRLWALTDVTLTIGWGRITALVGPNAAGKSTLMKTWIGFERPTRGRVLVGGVDPWQDRARAVALTAYLPQTPALYRELTAAELVELCWHYRASLDRHDALSRLRTLSVPLTQRVGSLSGGQVAQVGLAIALSTHAPVLLLDEPLGSLDPLARREFIDALKEGVRQTGTSVLLSSHVVSDIEQAADWVVVLGVGRKLLDMSLSEATTRHRVSPVDQPLAPDEELIARLPGKLTQLVFAGSRAAVEGSASLEDVVMGYLAKGRASDPAELPAAEL